MLGRAMETDRSIIGSILGFFSSSNDDADDEYSQVLKAAVVKKADMILRACLNCWNDLDIFRAREYFFTTFGMFPYQNEDKVSIERLIKND